MTNNLLRRVTEHKTASSRRGFAGRYRTSNLVYFESHPTAYSAILREKQIKAGSRKRKVDLIEGMNPQWQDLTGWLLGSRQSDP